VHHARRLEAHGDGTRTSYSSPILKDSHNKSHVSYDLTAPKFRNIESYNYFA